MSLRGGRAGIHRMGDPIIYFSDSTWSVQVFDGASSIYKTCLSPIPLLGIDIEALLHEECIVWRTTIVAAGETMQRFCSSAILVVPDEPWEIQMQMRSPIQGEMQIHWWIP